MYKHWHTHTNIYTNIHKWKQNKASKQSKKKKEKIIISLNYTNSLIVKFMSHTILSSVFIVLRVFSLFFFVIFAFFFNHFFLIFHHQFLYILLYSIHSICGEVFSLFVFPNSFCGCSVLNAFVINLLFEIPSP